MNEVLNILGKEYPSVKTALDYETPLQLLVAVILSAQCTDARVNIVTKDLFKKYRNIEDFASASQEEFEKDVHSTGFYRNKTKNILGACKMLLEDFGGEVPGTMEELIKLPGVARKTANVILHSAFGKEEGIAVDTHVIRLSGLIGLTKHKDPVKIEKDLVKITPPKDWGKFALTLTQHGREICVARKPHCSKCKLNKICKSAFKAKGSY
jgi:endonuclease III